MRPVLSSTEASSRNLGLLMYHSLDDALGPYSLPPHGKDHNLRRVFLEDDVHPASGTVVPAKMKPARERRQVGAVRVPKHVKDIVLADVSLCHPPDRVFI